MFNARYASISLACLVIFGLLVGVILTWMPPSPRRLAHDSHSGRASGHRAVFDLLQAFDVPVRRHHDTPDRLFAGHRRVVLIEPSLFRLEREHAHLAALAQWIRSGGQLVVASSTLHNAFDPETPACRREALEEILGSQEFLRNLGLEDLTTTHEPEGPTRRGPMGVLRKDNVAPDNPGPATPLRASGSLEYLGELVGNLDLEDPYDSFLEGSAIERAAGKIEIPVPPPVDDGGESGDEPEGTASPISDEWKPIALEFVLGEGRVTLVTCTMPFTNLGIGHGNNAVLAYHLAVGDGDREVVIDEFYHGGIQEGNWLSLLGMYPYGVIALFILAAALCHVWAHILRFGPSVAERTGTRRNIAEYIDAMARMFWRGRKWAFVLATCRSGIMDQIREDLRMAPSMPWDRVRRRMQQVAPARAAHLEKTLAAIDAALLTSARLNANAVLHFQEELEQCRIPTKSRDSLPERL